MKDQKQRFTFIGNGVTKLVTDKDGYSKLYNPIGKKKQVQEKKSASSSRATENELKLLIKELRDVLREVRDTFASMSRGSYTGVSIQGHPSQETYQSIDIDERLVVSGSDDVSSLEAPNSITTTKEVKDNSIEATRNKLRKMNR